MISNLKNDVLGGITAAIIALPLALSFGMTSGAGPMPGLYGDIVVGLFASIFGGTPSQISGPTGPMTVVMTSVFIGLNKLDPVNSVSLSFSAVVLAGLFQVFFSYFSLGKYFTLVKYPVISGFMTGVGCIIIILQIGPLIGQPSYPTPIANIINIGNIFSNIDVSSLSLGLFSLTLMVTWKGKLNKLFPSSLMTLILGTIISIIFFKESNLARVGEITASLPKLYWPNITLDSFYIILPSAFLLAILGSIDSLLGSLVADNITGDHHDSDKELFGQGIGNICSGLIGGLPGAGATMRTLVNIRTGGRGRLSGITHSVTLLSIVLGAGSFFALIPNAVLAGILTKVGIDIIDWPYIRKRHKMPFFNSSLMLIFLLLTVFVNLLTAIFIGVFIANMVTVEQLSKLQLDNVLLSDGKLSPQGLKKDELEALLLFNTTALLFRLKGPMSFGVAKHMRRRVEAFSNHKYLILDLSKLSHIGITTAIVLDEILKKEIEKNNNLLIVGDKKYLIQLKAQYSLTCLREECFYNSVRKALSQVGNHIMASEK